MKTIERLDSMEKAVEMANEIERLEAVLKLMKAELKKFVDDYGAIETDSKVWDYYPSVSWNFDEKGLKEMAQNIALEGLNPWELLTLSSTSLKKLGWNDDVLSQFGRKKETKRFSSRAK